MLLINAADSVDSRLLDYRIVRMAVKGLKFVLTKLGRRPTARSLLKGIGGLLFDRSSYFHLRAREQPPEAIFIAAIKTMEDLWKSLNDLKKVHKDDRDIRNALAFKPTPLAIQKAADIINRYAGRADAVIGGSFNLFWATTLDEVRSIEAKNAAKPLDEFARALRDRLGLGHIAPTDRAEKRYLFLFEAERSLDKIKETSDFLVTRPTTIEGFDNARFRQRRLPGSSGPSGFGQTIDLSGGTFNEGGPELVASQIRIGGNFRCRFVGCISAPADGTDEEFLEYIRDARPYSQFLDTLNNVK